MGSAFLNRQLEIRGSEYEMSAELSGASDRASLDVEDGTRRLPGKAESERSWNGNGQQIGGQQKLNGSQQMILQKQVVDRRAIGLCGVASNHTGGLPLWKRALDFALIVAVLPGLLI